MSRTLLCAEAAILSEAGISRDHDLIASQRVWREFHAPPRSKRTQWFNTDFVIELDNWDQRERPRAVSIPIRPRAMSGAYFVMITPSGVPTRLELLEGESSDMSSYRDEISMIEEAVTVLPELPGTVSVRDAPYLRVARLQKAIVFWVCTTTRIMDLVSLTGDVIFSEDSLVGYRAAASDILLDGVLYL